MSWLRKKLNVFFYEDWSILFVRVFLYILYVYNINIYILWFKFEMNFLFIGMLINYRYKKFKEFEVGNMDGFYLGKFKLLFFDIWF